MSTVKKTLLGIFIYLVIIAMMATSGSPKLTAIAAGLLLAGPVVVPIVGAILLWVSYGHNIKKNHRLTQAVIDLQVAGALDPKIPFSAQEDKLLRACEKRLTQIMRVQKRPLTYMAGAAVSTGWGLYEGAKLLNRDQRGR